MDAEPGAGMMRMSFGKCGGIDPENLSNEYGESLLLLDFREQLTSRQDPDKGSSTKIIQLVNLVRPGCREYLRELIQ
jgi:hypothetical protein